MLKGWLKSFRKISKNEAGETIFYPWRYPGEALVLHEEIKGKFLFRYRCLFWGAIFSAVIVSISETISFVSDYELTCVYAAIFSVYLCFYLILVLRYARKSRLELVSRERRPWKFLVFSWFFLYLQLGALQIIGGKVIPYGDSGFLMYLMLIVSVVMTVSLFFIIIKTRGYVLESGVLFGQKIRI